MHRPPSSPYNLVRAETFVRLPVLTWVGRRFRKPFEAGSDDDMELLLQAPRFSRHSIDRIY
jgi:hypothetical protein